MPKPVLATATITNASGIARDSAKNAFVFSTNTDDAAGWQACADAVIDFYNTVRASGAAVAYYIADHMSRAANGCRVDVYDLDGKLDGSPHGSPIYTKTFTLQGAITADSLPPEVALCLSFQTNDALDAPVEGTEQMIKTPAAAVRMGAPATHLGRVRPRSRKRGRLFIGPLTKSALALDGTGRPVPNPTLITTLGQAASALMNVASCDWLQWSRANAQARTVHDAWVDDAFDTQRRRGEKALSKTNVVTTDATVNVYAE